MQDQAAEVVAAMAQRANVFVLAQVEDEIGEATVRCALEGANLLGQGPGKIRPHRCAIVPLIMHILNIVWRRQTCWSGGKQDRAAAKVSDQESVWKPLLKIRLCRCISPGCSVTQVCKFAHFC